MDRNEMLIRVLNCLNSAYAADPQAVHALMANRVPVNQALADHPLIEVQQTKVVPGFNLGMIGVINGIMRCLDLPNVAGNWETNTDTLEFIGFMEYAPPEGLCWRCFKRHSEPANPGYAIVDGRKTCLACYEALGSVGEVIG